MKYCYTADEWILQVFASLEWVTGCASQVYNRRVIQHQNRLPRGPVVPPSLQTIKGHLDQTWTTCSSFDQEAGLDKYGRSIPIYIILWQTILGLVWLHPFYLVLITSKHSLTAILIPSYIHIFSRVKSEQFT